MFVLFSTSLQLYVAIYFSVFHLRGLHIPKSVLPILQYKLDSYIASYVVDIYEPECNHDKLVSCTMNVITSLHNLYQSVFNVLL